ncbi:hypothetical protein NMG60_11009093 [Bertholletia excelsa]
MCFLVLASSPEQQRRCLVKEGRVGRYVQSNELSSASKNITRVIHAGGHKVRHQNEVSACKLMEKYPGMLVARPEVFRRPHESLLSEEEKLLPGNKYCIIPRSTLRKLQERRSVKCRGKNSTKSKELLVDEKNITDSFEDWSQDSVRSAKDFYVSNEKWSRSSPSRGQRRKNLFVPPISKPRICKGLAWEPSLTSVQEISP